MNKHLFDITLTGKLIFLTQNLPFPIFIKSHTKGYVVLASRKSIPIDEKFKIKLLLYKLNQVRILAAQMPFPYIFEYNIDPNYPDIVVNIKLSRTNIHLTELYNFTNLNFEGCYGFYDENEEKENAPVIILKPIEAIAIMSFKNKNNKKYNRIRITISAKIQLKNDIIANNIKFEFISVTANKNHIIPLVKYNQRI